MIQRKENDSRNYFMINLHESMGPGRDRTRDPWIRVRLASVARHVTDCATRPGAIQMMMMMIIIIIIIIIFSRAIHMMMMMMMMMMSIFS